MKNKLIRTAFLSRIWIVGIGFINTIFINRILGPELKGEYAYIFNLVNILSLILGLSFGQLLPYFYRKLGDESRQKIINIIFFQNFMYIVIFALLYSFKIPIFFVIVFGLSIVVQLNTQITSMSILFNINKKNLINIFSISFYCLTLSLGYYSSLQNLRFVILAYVAYTVINLLCLLFANKIIVRFSNGFSFSFYIDLMKKGIVPTISALLILLNYSLDIILLEKMVTLKAVGLYSLGVTLAMMLWIIPDTLKEILFYKTYKKNNTDLIVKSINFSFYLSVFVILIFILIGREFIILLFGTEFENSFIVTTILFLGTIPMIFFKLINPLYIAEGKHLFTVKVLSISVIMNVVGNYYFIPILGIEGAAISSVLSYMFSGFVFLINFSNENKISVYEYFIPPQKLLKQNLKSRKREVSNEISQKDL